MLTVSSTGSAASTSRRLCLAAAGSAVMTWTGAVVAQAIPGVEVRWVAPATCPGGEDLQARLRRVLGPQPVALRADRLVAEGTVTRVNERYRLSLKVRRGGDAAVTRVFDSDSCESLAGAAVVTLALLARGQPRSDEAASSASSGGARSRSPAPPTPSSTGAPASSSSTAPASSFAGALASSPSVSLASPPSALPASSSTASPVAASAARASSPSTAPAPVSSASPTSPEPRSPALASASPAPNEVPAAAANRAAEARWSLVLGGPLLAADEGILPSWALGAGVGAGFRVNRFETLLTAVLWLPQNDGAANTNFYGGRYARRSGELSSCYPWGSGRFQLGPCLMVTLEDVTAQGAGPGVVGGPGGITWITLGVGARASWSPRPWTAVFVRPTLVFNTSRPKFAIDAVGSLYEVPLAAVGISVGCEWIL